MAFYVLIKSNLITTDLIGWMPLVQYIQKHCFRPLSVHCLLFSYCIRGSFVYIKGGSVWQHYSLLNPMGWVEVVVTKSATETCARKKPTAFPHEDLKVTCWLIATYQVISSLNALIDNTFKYDATCLEACEASTVCRERYFYPHPSEYNTGFLLKYEPTMSQTGEVIENFLYQ